MATRTQREKLFGFLYEPASCITGVCVYCGAPADSRDHVPSLAAIQSLGVNHFVAKGIQLHTYPACRECNSSLCAVELYAVEDRRQHLAAFYRQKYRKLLKMPDWSPEDLEELTGTLRRSVKAELRARDILRGRVGRLEGV